jgi:hypothetical protein
LNAVEITGVEERQAYVDECFAGNELLRQEVNALLAHHRQLDSSLAEFVPTMTIGCPPETPATVIGLYKLIEQIGEGGWGRSGWPSNWAVRNACCVRSSASAADPLSLTLIPRVSLRVKTGHSFAG